MIAKADVARSGNFPHWLTDLGRPIVSCRLIAAGFIDLRLRSKTVLSSWLTTDAIDQHFAKAAFAAAIVDLLREPSLAHLATSAGLARLTAIHDQVSAEWRFNPLAAPEGVDAVLAQVALRATAFRDLTEAARRDPAHPYHNIVELDAQIAKLVHAAMVKYPPTGSADRDQAAS